MPNKAEYKLDIYKWLADFVEGHSLEELIDQIEIPTAHGSDELNLWSAAEQVIKELRKKAGNG